MGCVCGVLAAVAAAGSARPEDAAAVFPAVLFPRAIPQQPAPVHLGIETSPLGVRFFDAVAIG